MSGHAAMHKAGYRRSSIVITQECVTSRRIVLNGISEFLVRGVWGSGDIPVRSPDIGDKIVANA